jgi:hypothetical protein
MKTGYVFFEDKLKTWDLNFCGDLQEVLNFLKSEDFFGTEGQNDPRNDFRENMELCENCEGEGCELCDEGYIDITEEMEEINSNNIQRILKEILNMENEDIKVIYTEYIDYIEV